jgi:hypothetical protein
MKPPMAFTFSLLYTLTTDGDFCHQGRETEIAQNIKIAKTY